MDFFYYAIDVASLCIKRNVFDKIIRLQRIYYCAKKINCLSALFLSNCHCKYFMISIRAVPKKGTFTAPYTVISHPPF